MTHLFPVMLPLASCAAPAALAIVIVVSRSRSFARSYAPNGLTNQVTALTVDGAIGGKGSGMTMAWQSRDQKKQFGAIVERLGTGLSGADRAGMAAA